MSLADRAVPIDRPTVRLLHTSDVHVASETSLDGLRGALKVAAASEVDAVLIAGDLFDSARVPDPAIEAVLAELSRVACPVVVIPGNHDCMDDRSIYHRVDLRDAGAHVFFVGEATGRTLFFEDLSLALWARGIEEHHPGHRPLAGYAPAGPEYWRVAMTHGHYVPAGQGSDRSSPIGQEEIGDLVCDYLALGHWHGFSDVSHGTVRACYSGSPSEPVGGEGTVNLVTLDPRRGVEVERLPV